MVSYVKHNPSNCKRLVVILLLFLQHCSMWICNLLTATCDSVTLRARGGRMTCDPLVDLFPTTNRTFLFCFVFCAIHVIYLPPNKWSFVEVLSE